ncbi:MAG: hypothetical protein LBP55_08495 [Candidatus Adiutrix sp.]|jgi:hypothetical protein|nr:hypothetical protein [Candidatus Adiutrix sp.]
MSEAILNEEIRSEETGPERPTLESPADYQLAELLGETEADESFLGPMGATMFEAGLSKDQARSLVKTYQELWRAGQEEESRRYEAEVAAVLAATPPAECEAARRAFRGFGLNPEEGREVARSLESSLGPKRAVSLMARLGRLLAEDRPVGGRGPSPVSARERMDHLLNQPEFSRRYLSGDSAALEEISALAREAVGE